MEEKGKEEGWNQAKRSKTSHKKSANANAKSPQAGLAKKPSMESQAKKFEILGSEIMTMQETEILKDISPSKASPSKSVRERSKGRISKEEEGTQESEELEEEGEIGESQSSPRRYTRGCVSTKEKREQETYKDKLHGNQPMLEKFLAKTLKMKRIQTQSSKGAHHNKIK